MRFLGSSVPAGPGRPGGGTERDAEFTAYAQSAVSRLRDTAYLMCRDWHLADDLTQVALIKLSLAWSRVSKVEDVDAYARKVLLRTYIDHRRRRWTREVVTSSLPETPAGNSPDLMLTLVDALALLRPQDRAILVLRYWEGYSVEQVASLLEIRAGAVKTRTTRALAKLREVLQLDLAELLG
jgi:RNA polymerase sigma-70 factor (sigma-E family)